MYGINLFELIIQKKIDYVKERSKRVDLFYIDKGFKYLPKRNNVYIIYEEPLDGSMPMNMYIGVTKNDISVRFNEHITEIKKMIKKRKIWRAKYYWMFQVMESKNELKMFLLNSVNEKIIYDVENEWISFLKLNGFNLFNKSNKKYYKK